jgi:phosphoglycolate phosphatase
VLEYFELIGCFEAICGSESDGRFSRKTDSLAQLIRTRQLEPSTTVMVGDREHDIIGARSRGIRSIAVTYGYGSRRELEAARPDMICESPEELLRALTGEIQSADAADLEE